VPSIRKKDLNTRRLLKGYSRPLKGRHRPKRSIRLDSPGTTDGAKEFQGNRELRIALRYRRAVDDLPTEVCRVVHCGAVMGITGGCAARSVAKSHSLMSSLGWSPRQVILDTDKVWANEPKSKTIRSFGEESTIQCRASTSLIQEVKYVIAHVGRHKTNKSA
jgi:hypothetical protein